MTGIVDTPQAAPVAPVAATAPQFSQVLPLAGTVAAPGDTKSDLFSDAGSSVLSPSASSGQKEKDKMEETANPLLQLAAALIDLHTTLHGSEADAASECWLEERPALFGPARWSQGAAALCMAAFGSDVVPEVEQDNHGDRAQVALQIARVYLSLPNNHPAMVAMETLALVAQRRHEGDASLSTE